MRQNLSREVIDGIVAMGEEAMAAQRT